MGKTIKLRELEARQKWLANKLQNPNLTVQERMAFEEAMFTNKKIIQKSK